MSILNTSSSWNVGRASGRCAACGAELTVDKPCWAALCDGLPAKRKPEAAPAEKVKKGAAAAVEPPSPFVRIDFCEGCWGQGKRPEGLSPVTLGLAEEGQRAKLAMFSFWKTTMPLPQQKKKLLVDDSVLVDVFQRMEGKTEPQEERFRFVLALILMRKRLLKYESTVMVDAKPNAAPAASSAPAADAGGSAEGSPPTAAPSPIEVWRMLPKATEPGGGWGAAVDVVNPHLTEQQITEVSQQLSEILAEEV
jgi:hypothetical protein